MLIKLGKLTEAFSFLEQSEGLIVDEQSSRAYSQAIAELIEYLVTLPKQEIEIKFLSVNFTRMQDREIDAYLQNKRTDLLVVREFWNRKPVKGVGLAIKFNWNDTQNSSQ